MAERFGVSARTIRYDLDALDNWFAEQQLALIKKPRFGVEVAGQEDVKQAALAQLADSGQDRYRYPLKPEERVRFIIFQLLQSPEKVVIDELASLLNVSRGTLLPTWNKQKPSWRNTVFRWRGSRDTAYG